MTIDDVGARLLTDRVDEDAKPIVLCAGSLLRMLEVWASSRLHESDPRHESWPGANRMIARRLLELRRLLAGESVSPPAQLETIGTMLSHDVSPRQLCEMLGLVSADGQPALSALARLIDTAFAATPYREEAHGVLFVGGDGFISLDDAWTSFSNSAETRRQRILDRRHDPARFGIPAEARNDDSAEAQAFRRAAWKHAEVAEAKRRKLQHAQAMIEQEFEVYE